MTVLGRPRTDLIHCTALLRGGLLSPISGNAFFAPCNRTPASPKAAVEYLHSGPGAGSGLFRCFIHLSEQDVSHGGNPVDAHRPARRRRNGTHESCHEHQRSERSARAKHLEETLRLNPGYVLANINLGLYLMDHGDREKGLRLVERAVELSPSWAQCHYWLSKAYARLGRKRDAFEAAVRAAELDPRCFDCQYNAALLAQQKKAYAESLKYLSAIERRTPRFKQTLFLKGFALQMSGKVGEAVSAYRKFLVSESNHYQAHFNLAHAYMTLGNCKDAVSHFKKTLTLKPDYTEANLYIHRCTEKSDTQN